MTKPPQLPPFPYQVPDSVYAKAKKIKLALFDVDGVLTDGCLHYSRDGERVKVFNALDGHGLKMLQQTGVQVGVISARNSAALQKRLSDLNIQHCYLGVGEKHLVLLNLLEQLDLAAEQCAFTGDDVIDLPAMSLCGLKLSVENGHFMVRQIADWVTPIAGGSGAVRAICDLLLYSQENYPLKLNASQVGSIQ